MKLHFVFLLTLCGLAGCHHATGSRGGGFNPYIDPKIEMSLISSDKELDQDPVPKIPIQAVTQYPWELKRAGIEGTVEARLSIDEHGFVAKVEILSSPPPGKYFEDAVSQGAPKCQFFPAVRKGHVVACTVVYQFKFTLDGL